MTWADQPRSAAASGSASGAIAVAYQQDIAKVFATDGIQDILDEGGSASRAGPLAMLVSRRTRSSPLVETRFPREDRGMELQELIRRAVEIGKRTGFITFDQVHELCRQTEGLRISRLSLQLWGTKGFEWEMKDRRD
jgi:hypothetical protein